MNTILQKRIEEAAERYSVSWRKNPDGSESKEMFPVAAERSFKAGATFALQNQWISVKEALPEVDGHGYSKPVLVMDDTNELLVSTYSKIYDKWNVVGPVSYHRLVVTHWMPIPSLEGGEK